MPRSVKKRNTQLTTNKVRKIVRTMTAQTRELKHLNIAQTDQVISNTGVNFEISPSSVAQGLDVNNRVGNKINWKSYYMRMILKGGNNMAGPHQVRVIWYLPRISDERLPTTTTVLSFIDPESFIVVSDKIHKVGTSINRAAGDDAPSGTQNFKILNYGKKFKKPSECIYDSPSAGSLISNRVHCYVVSTNPSTSLSYGTSLDLRATMYFTDP